MHAPIHPYKRETNTFPLSFAQQRLWFLDQMEPGSTAYILSRVQRFRDYLSMEALEHSLEDMMQRHEMLRTTFEERDGQPVQIIQRTGRHTFPVIDMQGLGHAARDSEIQRLIRQEAQNPFNLAQGPLFRMALVRSAAQEHVMLLTLHHIITDQWSNEILVRELTALYQAHLTGQSLSLAVLPIQYADYALWQQQWLQGQVLETQLTYWRKQLAGVAPLELPFDHPRPAVQTYRGATQTQLVPAVVLTQLQMLSQQEGTTLFMLLLAAFQVLLLRYTGQSDISVGTPIANRTRAEIEGVIGFFVNTLVMRSDLSGNPTFQQFLGSVREVCLQAYAHQDIPFEKVVEALEPERDLSHTPLFQVMFVLQNALREQGERSREAQEPLLTESTNSKFDLTLSIRESRQGLICSLEYNIDLFKAATITRLFQHWQVLLEGLVQNAQAHISDVPLLTVSEREQLVVAWNDTQAAYPEHLCLHNLFEQQVARTPDAIALEYEDEQVTYKRLDRLANQVAHYIQRLGVGPDVLVGVGLERSFALVIGILGILKAGGAYVPLDTTYPRQRLVSIIEEAHISIVLTMSQFRENLPVVEHVVCLDREWSIISSFPGEEPPSTTTLPANLAYVIYTSGSTGRPKGVMIPHQGVVHYVDWSSKYYEVIAGSGSPVHSPLSFDLTVTSLFPALVVGRRLVLVPEAPGIESLSQVLRQQNEFSLLKITPAHLDLLGQVLQPEDFSTAAKALIIGGEALHSDSVRVWRESVPTIRLINEYGPTETVVGCCIYEIAQDEKLVGAVPIGRPLPNTQIYLLDAQLQLVPFGVPGELYIGGVGLGRGYLNRPDLTAERFIANPFSTEPGRCLYKTGDVARYRAADGTLEYLGRIDNQVKLRGYRIELAEIEAVLRQDPQVVDCAALLQEEGVGGPRLISYVVERTSGTLTAEVLTGMLRKYFPIYMLPSAFIMVDALPLSSNGKVDRRQLSGLEPTLAMGHMALSEPRSPIEEMLLKIWRDLLTQPTLGIHDNFFAVGGHSLLATRLIAQIRAVLQIDIPVRLVFDAPTVAELAQSVALALGKNVGQKIPPLVAMERPEAIPLSFAQQRLWFVDQLQPGNSAYLIPRAQRFLGPMHMQALERGLEELTRRHESLRTTFTVHSGQPVQVIHPAERYCLPLIDLQGLPGEQQEAEARHLSRLEARQPCNLEQGPLLRTYLIRLNDQEHVLLLTLHHIITDGWSNEVVVDELASLYRAYRDGQPSPLSPLPIQYADYALWQRQWLQGEELDAQLDYWIRQLGGSRPIELPIDYVRPAIASSRGAVHAFALSEDLSQAVMALSREEGVTLFMTLLAAFQVLFYRYTGQADVVIGTDSTNRNHVETEGIVGFFVNLLALRVDLSGRPTFQEVLKRVRAVVLGAYTHCDTPFELLVEKLAPDHHLERMPLVQALFVLQNIPVRAQDLAELQVESKALDQQLLPQPELDKEAVVKFDVALFMQEHAGKLFGTLNYRLDLFQARTIATMMARFVTLLQSITDQPDIPIDLLAMISQAEQEQQQQEEQKRRKSLRMHSGGWLDFPAIDIAQNKNE
ncbi:non-ribosomal peptide synthetase [Ktedonobacteria bacterium brp13]|nr:non-ribosomal peptide synthetase [Ktedonobacteria bacterium brp13]